MDPTHTNPAQARVKRYVEVLNPLFWDESFYAIDLFFEYVCTLLRASGVKDTGWESYYESLAFLADFKALGEIELATQKFADPAQTRTRLALISYCHVTEMNLPYELLANLLRLRVGGRYAMHPFAHLRTPITKKISGIKTIVKWKEPSPEKKIKEIENLSEAAGLPEVGKALRGIYDPIIRNAVYHSDYVVHPGGLRLLSDHRFSQRLRVITSEVESEDLVQLTAEAFGFYSALDILYRRSCTLLVDYRNKFLPFDQYLKGILELTFEGDVLTGFRTYWPNRTLCVYHRSVVGSCDAINLHFNTDGSINFFVGELFKNRSAFSPCVEDGKEPVYPTVPGSSRRPCWPEALEAFEL